MNPVEKLESVLCDPEGKCCISGGDADRQIVDEALTALSATIAQPEQAALAAKDAEIEDLKNDLRFVERWANHHGQKPHMSAKDALSCIQHYPAIRAITKSYTNGKAPETRDPYVEIATLTAERDALRKDAARYRWLRDPSNWNEAGISPIEAYGEYTVHGEYLDRTLTAMMTKETK